MLEGVRLMLFGVLQHVLFKAFFAYSRIICVVDPLEATCLCFQRSFCDIENESIELISLFRQF